MEWPSAINAGVTPSSNAAGAIFFIMTGMHAFHVLTGVIFLSIVLRNGCAGLYSAEKHWAVEIGNSLLALYGCGLDFLLSGLVFDRQTNLKLKYGDVE